MRTIAYAALAPFNHDPEKFRRIFFRDTILNTRQDWSALWDQVQGDFWWMPIATRDKAVPVKFHQREKETKRRPCSDGNRSDN